MAARASPSVSLLAAPCADGADTRGGEARKDLRAMLMEEHWSLFGDQNPADDLLAGTFRHIDPFVLPGVGLRLPGTRVCGCAAVVLSSLDDAAALLHVLLGGQR